MPQPLTAIEDTNKLKKHLSILCERLNRGSKLYVAPL